VGQVGEIATPPLSLARPGATRPAAESNAGAAPRRLWYARGDVATKSVQSSEEKAAEIEEALDALDKLIDRLKVLYEQYFMGIQKQAPSHLHNDAERRLRDVAQLQIRNTALRYRFATLQQKFGAYNTYWKRTLRDIEAGRYLRNLSKLRRQAQLTGEALPEEIMAAMPKRMRDAIERDRANALAEAQRRKLVTEPVDSDSQPAVIRAPAPPPEARPRAKSITTDPFTNVGEDDIAAALSSLADEALAAIDEPRARTPRAGHDTIPSPPPRMPPAAAPPSPPPRVPPPPPRTSPAAAPPRPPPGARPSGPSTSTSSGMSDAAARALYAKYMKAREVVGDRNDGMTFEKLVRTVESQGPKILQQHKASAVEWNVVIRDNKVVLKAKPKT
jgi:hypothetical protein